MEPLGHRPVLLSLATLFAASGSMAGNLTPTAGSFLPGRLRAYLSERGVVLGLGQSSSASSLRKTIDALRRAWCIQRLEDFKQTWAS